MIPIERNQSIVSWPRREDSVPPAPEAICCVIVTHHPDSGFFNRAERITKQVAKLVIVDNGSSEDAVHHFCDIASKLNAHLILNKRNEGIAKALNQGVRWAEARGFEWALTLDQDSLVANDIVERLSGVYKEYPEREKLAVIGSNYTDPVMGRPFLMSERNDRSSWHEVKTTITSGSLLSLFAFREIGPFREEFFIDCVDFEYCLRARSRGLRIIMARKPLMGHPIGAVTLHNLPWKMTATSNHSPVRRYYMTRNQLVLAREYLGKEPIWTTSTLCSHFKGTILMCLFEKDILRKVKWTAMGVLDGLFSNFNRKLT